MLVSQTLGLPVGERPVGGWPKCQTNMQIVTVFRYRACEGGSPSKDGIKVPVIQR
jgi:hypothetical protein